MVADRLPPPAYRADIDGLRAIAVLAVVAFHAFPNRVPGGFVGVDVFFVISGFLITTLIVGALERGTFTYAEFYARRIRRLFPALTVVLVATLVAGTFLLSVDDLKQLGKHVAAGAGFVANLVFWSESGYFDADAASKPLLHLWSLGIEEQFYFVWPALLVVAWKRGWRLAPTIAAVGIVSFVLNVVAAAIDPSAAFYSPFTRFWELALGAWLAASKATQGPKPWRNAASWSGLVMIVVAIFAFSNALAYPGAWALLPTVGAALVILGGADSALNRLALSQRIMVEIGLISYPLYLWHWPLLSFAWLLERQVPALEVRWAAVVLAIALAWITYRLIEAPLRHGKALRAKTIGLVIAMAIAGGAGLDCYRRDGWAFRFPPEVRMLVTPANFEWPKHVRTHTCLLQRFWTSEHAAECRDTRHPLMILWGDSHGAALYPGLRKLQEQRGFGLSQFTQAGCPPILDLQGPMRRENCSELNRKLLDRIVADAPEAVVLHAAWLHEHYPVPLGELEEKLGRTLEELRRRLPNSDIVVIGPVPRWNSSPQAASFERWKASQDPAASVPKMLDATVLGDIEALVARASARGGARYLSASKVLCDGGKCLARVGNEPADFVAIDKAHLSKAGAEYLAEKLSPELLARFPYGNIQGRSAP